MAKLGVQRDSLAQMLSRHGEQELAARVMSCTDHELNRIQTLGAYYAFSDRAMALGGSMGGTRALSLATIDVLEQSGRDLNISRTTFDLQGGDPDRFTEVDRVRDAALRAHPPAEMSPPPGAEPPAA